MKSIAIIGGGAAGMMAAAVLAQLTQFMDEGEQPNIMLFEKNTHLGAKVLISGGGRCNVTTGLLDVKDLLQNYPRGAKFLMTAMYHFPPERVMEWFEERGVPLKTEDDLRVFPVSDNGQDIVAALQKELSALHHSRVLLKANVSEVQKKAKKGKDIFQITLADGQVFEADYVVLTTGGNAYRSTGSTGDGYAFAKALGHSITPLAPSLNSFKIAEKWVSDLSGVSYEKAAFTLYSVDQKEVYKRTGPFLFTHTGVTGPAIFALSAASAYQNYFPEKPMKLAINFFPDQNAEQFRQNFLDLVQRNIKKNLINVLDIWLPRSLCVICLEILQLSSDLEVSQLSKKQQAAILDLLQSFTLQVIGRGVGDEFVTAGGVDLSEVKTNTMESKICPNLYFAGEILDVDGYTGGFNLQASWATGNLVGESIADQITNS